MDLIREKEGDRGRGELLWQISSSKWQHFVKMSSYWQIIVIGKLLRNTIKFHHSHTSVFTRYGVQNPILHSI